MAMQVIDEARTVLWLAKNGIVVANGQPSFTTFVEILSTAVPPDSGRKTALSRTIASLFKDDDEALLWINEVGIWPSSEDRFLFDGFRRSLGEESPLPAKPGHLFSRDDLAPVASLVALVLYFVWGAILYSPARALVIKISHDELISVFVRVGMPASDVTEVLTRILLK
jgi:hypothetical protein